MLGLVSKSIFRVLMLGLVLVLYCRFPELSFPSLNRCIVIILRRLDEWINRLSLNLWLSPIYTILVVSLVCHSLILISSISLPYTLSWRDVFQSIPSLASYCLYGMGNGETVQAKVPLEVWAVARFIEYLWYGSEETAFLVSLTPLVGDVRKGCWNFRSPAA